MIKISFIKAPNSQYLGDRTVETNFSTLGNSGVFCVLKEDLFLPLINLELKDGSLEFKTNYEQKVQFQSKERILDFPFKLKKNDTLSFGSFEILIKDIATSKEKTPYKEILRNNFETIKKDENKFKLVKELQNLSS